MPDARTYCKAHAERRRCRPSASRPPASPAAYSATRQMPEVLDVPTHALAPFGPADARQCRRLNKDPIVARRALVDDVEPAIAPRRPISKNNHSNTATYPRALSRRSRPSSARDFAGSRNSSGLVWFDGIDDRARSVGGGRSRERSGPNASPHPMSTMGRSYDGAHTSNTIETIHLLGVGAEVEFDRFFRLVHRRLLHEVEDPSAGRRRRKTGNVLAPERPANRNRLIGMGETPRAESDQPSIERTLKPKPGVPWAQAEP
jgi:hypothetical protein